jgi:hypothetical protein
VPESTTIRITGPGMDTTFALPALSPDAWRVAAAALAPASDYYPFVRHGVPVVFLMPGDGPYLTASDSQRSARWGRYHMPDDNWDERCPFRQLGRYADFATEVVRRLDERLRQRRCGALTAYRSVGDASRTGPGGSR